MQSFLKKIESKRNSGKPIDKTAVAIKDALWRISYFFSVLILCFKEGCLLDFLGNIPRPLLNKGKLPDFIIAGADKSGTTYLWRLLKKHPDIEMSPHFLGIYENKNKEINGKETNFFLRKKISGKDIRYYKSLFNKNVKLQGEASPTYLAATCCHRDMHKFLPDAKIIILLRNPVDRAFSAFNHMIKEKINVWGAGSGYDAKKNFSDNAGMDIRSGFRCGQIISNGFYIEKIKSLLKYYPKNQLLIIITERMKKNPKEAYADVCNFLGIENTTLNLEERIHIGTYFEKLDDQIAKKLYNLYEPYNAELYKFLGYEIKEWEDAKKALFN
jgi:hypothetical protein